MKLIVNADDFGLTKGVSLGILDSMEKGIVTSTTALVNGIYFEEGIKEALNRGLDSLGVHLNLTLGKPVLPPDEIPSLVREDGSFYRAVTEIKKINYDEAKRELKAQIEKFLQLHSKPTHFDGHHHFFFYDEGLLDVVLDLAREYGVPIRSMSPEKNKYYKTKDVMTTDILITEFYRENVNADILMDLIERYDNLSTVELMCHPAHLDEELMKITSYNTFRQEEYNILISDTIKDYLNKAGIELITFKDITN